MWEVFWVVLITAFIFDQLTKAIVVKSKFPHLINKYGPLGLYRKHLNYRFLIWSLHIAIIIPLFITSNFYLFLGAGLISAQISNIFDRLFYKGAVDFIPLPTPFPKLKTAYFNFADLCIAAGDIIYIMGIYDLLK